MAAELKFNVDRTPYNQCVASGLKGKRLSKYEHQLEFCITSKLCSKKASDREEAEKICKLPKPPKSTKSRMPRSEKAIIKEIQTEVQCVIPKIDMDKASNINSLEVQLVDAMIQCRIRDGKAEGQG